MSFWVYAGMLALFWIIIIAGGYLILTLMNIKNPIEQDLKEIKIWAQYDFGNGLPDDFNKQIFQHFFKYLFFTLFGIVIVYFIYLIIEHFFVV